MPKKQLAALQRPDLATYRAQPKTPFVLVLDNVRSAANVGAAFRTADGFALQHLYLCGITAQPPHREILKTAIGATESVDWTYAADTPTLLRELRARGYRTVGVEQTTDSVSLLNFELDKRMPYAFVLGNEVQGVSDAALAECELALEIPQLGTKHSFNVAVCGGMVLWEAFRQWSAAGATGRAATPPPGR